jgi:hypothetical protein
VGEGCREESAAAVTGKRVVPCPLCGVLIVLDDATCTIRHANPVCAGMLAKMAEFGLKTTHGKWAEVINAKTGEVVQDGDDVQLKGAGKA